MPAHMSVRRINNLILRPINAVYKIMSRKIYSLKYTKYCTLFAIMERKYR